MKKVFSLALAALLTLSVGMTAMAAPSPTAEDARILAEAVTVSADLGTAEELDLSIVTAANTELQNLFASLVEAARGGEAETTVVLEDGTLVIADENTPLGAVAEPEMLAAFEFVPTAAVLDEIAKNGSTVVEFAVASVKAGDNVSILHLLTDKNEWEVIDPLSVEDGKVTASFTSFSPVIITRMPIIQSANAGAEAVAVAPVQGGSNTGLIVVLSVLAVAVVVAGAVFGVKKSKKN